MGGTCIPEVVEVTSVVGVYCTGVSVSACSVTKEERRDREPTTIVKRG